MTRIINGYNATKLQVETDRVDVWSPDGLAISNGRHDVQLTDLISVNPSGLSKSGNQTGFNRTTWQQVTSWTVRTGYSSTTLSSNGISIGTKHRGIIKFYARFSDIWWYRITMSLRIKINGVVAREITHTTHIGSIIFVADLEVGDLVTVEAKFEAKKDTFSGGIQYATGTLLSSSWLTIEKYDRSALDFQYDMCFDNASSFYFSDNLSMVGPDFGKKQPEVYDIDVEEPLTSTGDYRVTKHKTHNWGPVLAQSLFPIPVEEGYIVDMSGKFRVRRLGIEQEDNFFGNDFNIRFSVWGKGFVDDEYGQNPVDVELLFHEATLQTSFATGLIDITLPDLEAVIVPENINRVYFTCVLQNADDETPMPGNFKHVSGGTAENVYFGWYNSQPLTIMVTPPAEKVTYEHPVSLTGVAYKDRQFFTNVQEPKTLTFMGAPGATASISVYAYNMGTSTRETLIGTYSALANERKSVTVASTTGAIEIDSAGDYFIESLLAEAYDEMYETQTRLERITWQDVTDDLNNIEMIREEYRAGSLKLKFVSNELADGAALRPGKRCRLLAVHYGTNRPGQGKRRMIRGF